MNRFGNGALPEREMTPNTPAKKKTREQLAAEMQAYLEAGGVIEQPTSVPLRCKPMTPGSSNTVRRWADDVPNMKTLTIKQRVKRQRRRTAAQRITLPGSHTGPKPDGKKKYPQYEWVGDTLKPKR